MSTTKRLTLLGQVQACRTCAIAAICLSRSFPASPTNGNPVSSSSAPGASPTKHSDDSGSPLAKTTCFRVEPCRSTTDRKIWGRGGDGYERSAKLGPLELYVRTEDQPWSPYHVERRVEHGIRLHKLKPAAASGRGEIGIAIVSKHDAFRADYVKSGDTSK